VAWPGRLGQVVQGGREVGQALLQNGGLHAKAQPHGPGGLEEAAWHHLGVVALAQVLGEGGVLHQVGQADAARDSGPRGHPRHPLLAKRHTDDEYGIVLLSDIARQVLAKDRAPERVNVYEIMSKPVLSVPSAMDIRYCARLFDKFGLTLAPVIDDGPVLGIVTYSNMVLRGLARHE